MPARDIALLLDVIFKSKKLLINDIVNGSDDVSNEMMIVMKMIVVMNDDVVAMIFNKGVFAVVA